MYLQQKVEVRFCALLAAFIVWFMLGACTTTQSTTDYIEIGNQYAKDGLLREASEAYQKAILSKNNVTTARRNMGIVQVKLGEYKAAVRNLEKSMNVYEDNFDANYYLAEAYRGLDQHAEALFRYQRANKLKANDVRVLKALAWSYFKIRYYSEALSTASTLIKKFPNDSQAAIIYARIQIKSNNPKAALMSIRNARKIADASTKPYLDSVEGDAYFAMGKLKAAEKMYQSALKDQPVLPGALLGLGQVYAADSKKDKAIVLMERALRIRPKLTEALVALAKIYEDKDKLKSAKYYQAFLKQAQKDPEFANQVLEAQNKLASLQEISESSDQTENK